MRYFIMSAIFQTDKKIRLGVWGLGRGSSLIRTADKLNIEIVAGCDVNPYMQNKFRNMCPDAFITDNEDEFLNYPMDAVLIATFFQDHAKHAIRALNAGLHVMSEVTSFITPAEGVQLVEAVEKSGKVYQLLENYPFTKENMFLSDLWSKGFFGEFMYGEFDYFHECRMLCYGYNTPGYPAVEPGNTAHSWRSWLNFHYYATHSLGPLMQMTNLRPETVSALPEAVALPGYLPESGMSKPCPSVIQMSNGGLMRNLVGAATGDYHAGKRIWGTLASAESLGHDLIIKTGAAGNGTKLRIQPEWPALAEIANTAGHGGGDFWELYYFARQIFTGEEAPWDIYKSSDVTLAGIMAVRSQENGGKVMEIPDFRKAEVRDRYRNDHGVQQHFDPAKIFPENAGSDSLRFNSLMLDIIQDSTLWRKVQDGAILWKNLKDDASRMNVMKAVEELQVRLPELVKHIKEAESLIANYPEAPAIQALKGILSLYKGDDLSGDLNNKLQALRKELLMGK